MFALLLDGTARVTSMANGQVATPAGSGTSHARKFGIFTQGEDVVIKALFVWKLIGFWGRGKGGILARWKL